MNMEPSEDEVVAGLIFVGRQKDVGGYYVTTALPLDSHLARNSALVLTIPGLNTLQLDPKVNNGAI